MLKAEKVVNPPQRPKTKNAFMKEGSENDSAYLIKKPMTKAPVRLTKMVAQLDPLKSNPIPTLSIDPKNPPSPAKRKNFISSRKQKYYEDSEGSSDTTLCSSLIESSSSSSSGSSTSASSAVLYLRMR